MLYQVKAKNRIFPETFFPTNYSAYWTSDHTGEKIVKAKLWQKDERRRSEADKRMW